MGLHRATPSPFSASFLYLLDCRWGALRGAVMAIPTAEAVAAVKAADEQLNKVFELSRVPNCERDTFMALIGAPEGLTELATIAHEDHVSAVSELVIGGVPLNPVASVIGQQDRYLPVQGLRSGYFRSGVEAADDSTYVGAQWSQLCSCTVQETSSRRSASSSSRISGQVEGHFPTA